MATPDFSDIAALRATFSTHGPSGVASAETTPPHISDVIHPIYCPEVYGMYDPPDDVPDAADFDPEEIEEETP